MARYILAPAAERDIQAILAHSQEHFGEQARIRYEALIIQAILDVAEDSDHAGSTLRPEISAAARTYHLQFSRTHVASQARVKRPRHFLLYRVSRTGDVEIGRVLHDSMDLDRHLPGEFRRDAGGESDST